jgi:hypothetical protein
VVGDEVGGLCAVILDGICFGIVAAVDIHPDKVISEDPFENAHVISDDGLGPVRLSLSYVGSVAGLVSGRLDLRQGRDEQKKRRDHAKSWPHDSSLREAESDFNMGSGRTVADSELTHCLTGATLYSFRRNPYSARA